MHTTYTDKGGGGGSLKNTKINYTKDLLRHCLLNLWEDFAILCVCVLQVSVQAVCRSFQGGKKNQMIFVALSSARKHRCSVFWKGQKHSDDISGERCPGGHTWFFMKQICLEQPKEGGKLMSSFSEDKCFNCYHTDFFTLV